MSAGSGLGGAGVSGPGASGRVPGGTGAHGTGAGGPGGRASAARGAGGMMGSMSRPARIVALAVLSGLTLIAMSGFQPPYGGWFFIVPVIAGLVAGLAAALGAAALRLNALNSVLLAIAAFFLAGTPAAMPGEALWGFLPTLSSLGALALGAVFSWRDIITLQPPISTPDYMLVLPYLATLIVAFTGATLIVRWLPARPRAAWRDGLVVLGPVLLMILTILDGTSQPLLGVPRAVLFTIIALVWLGRGREGSNAASAAARRGLRRHRLAGTAVIALIALAAGGGAGLLLQPGADRERFVLREAVTPPLRPLQVESPLATFRSYTKAMHDTVLFEVSGLQQGDHVRLATLDAYDGRHWTIMDPELGVEAAGTYNLVGEEVPQARLLTASSARTAHVEVEGYQDIWMPVVGAPERIRMREGTMLQHRADLRFNGETGGSILTSGLRQGDAYTVTADVQDVPLEGQLDNTPVAELRMPPGPPPPAALIERMQTFIQGETSTYLQLRAIEQSFVSQGYLSHGSASDMAPSRAGHGLDRMQELFDLSYMVGDAEQYASAMALMAQQLGCPVRVVMGFAPSSGPDENGAVPVLGSDVTAWVEVPFEGFGWVAFHPTPDRTDVPINTTTEPQTKPKAQVRQPPQSDERPDELITAAESPDDDQQPGPPFKLPLWARIVLLGVTLPLVLLGVLLLALELARRRRRARRREAEAAPERLVGAWDEAIDRLAELGRPIPGRQTRRATAKLVEPALMPVAVAADRAVFADDDVDERDVERVWEQAERIVREADRDAGRWRRLLARYRYRVRLGDLLKRRS